MRNAVHLLSSAAAASLLVALTLPVVSAPAAAQSSEIRVLVAPLIVQGGVDRRFGERVANEVRKALEDFGGLIPIEERDVNNTLKQFDLKAENMTMIEWRQLASRMNAGMVMIGSAGPATGGVEVDVGFQDPGTGDALPVPKFTVASDRQHQEAAQRIMQSLERGVEYSRSIAFCSEYLASEQVEDALRNCEQALQINPNSTRALYLRGRAHMVAMDWSTAVADLERVVEESPSNTEALQSLAYTHAKLGNKDRSLELYREYLNFNPDDAAVRLNIAFELASAGAFGEAMSILQDGVERDPENADLLEYLGNVALSAGTGEGGEVADVEAIRVSVDAFDKVLTIKGDNINPTILSNVINAKVLLGEYQEALDFSERAIQLIENPPPAEAGEAAGSGEEPQMSKEQLLSQIHSARANVYSRMERFGDAATALEKAMSLDPNLPDGNRRVALLKLRAGDSEGAIAGFRTAVREGADPDVIAQALFGQAYNDHFQGQQRRQPAGIDLGELGRAMNLFEVAAEFATAPDVAHQVHFFMAYGYYLRGTAIDARNEQAEACDPARSALSAFRNVGPHLGRAGSYQGQSQASIRDAVDVQLYRQEQIIRAACS